MVDWRRLSDEQLLNQCRVEAFRGPGPGGQKRNKTSSAVRLTHTPTGISALAGESRSQRQNRTLALRRLRHRIALLVRQPWNADRAPIGLRISRRSADYPAVMGAVLDVLAARDWSVRDSAAAIGTTTAQLVRFLRSDEKLWSEVNTHRRQRGLKPLV
ncbi:MAG: peptide chain release factor-like protein [Tepidisphaeraceae bacterium]|jgi:hypothetical protein